MNEIAPLQSDVTRLGDRTSGVTPAPQSGEKSFSTSMTRALAQTDELISNADRAATGVAEGTTDTVEALIALSKAELALRHVVSMTTRALEAYREVMRMQL